MIAPVRYRQKGTDSELVTELNKQKTKKRQIPITMQTLCVCSKILIIKKGKSNKCIKKYC